MQGAYVVATIIQGNMIITANNQVNTTLKTLDISHNTICNDGAVAIGEYLKLNSTLEEFILSDNKLL